MKWRPRPYLTVLRNALLTDMEYRTNYLILMLSIVISMLMELAIFRQIYGDRDLVGGLTRAKVMPFVLLGILIRSGSTVWSLVFESVDNIRDGSFRKFLLQPVHFPSYFFAQTIGPKIPTWTIATVAVIALKFFPGFEELLPARNVAPFLLALALSYVLMWQIYLAIVYSGFWLEEATFLNSALNLGIGIFSGTQVPFAWLPDRLQAFLKFTPFPVIGDFPLRAGLGTLLEGEYEKYLFECVLWIAFMILLNAQLWRSGTRTYEAYGG